MRLRFTTFQGELPRLHKTLLPDGAAQVALDTNHERGTLKSLHDDLALHDASPSVPADFYLHNGTSWLTFSKNVDVVPGPVADDRLYITYDDGSAPIMKDMSDGGAEYPLALPTPSAAPITSIETASQDATYGDPQTPYDPGLTNTEFITALYNDVLGRDPDAAGLAFWVGLLDDGSLTREEIIDEFASRVPPSTSLPQEDRIYVYTWVSSFDEESLPSPPSTSLTVIEGSTVNVSFIDQPPSGSRINRLRVYVSQTTALGATEFFFIKEFDIGVTAYVHDFETDPLQELLPSASYDPPVTGLEGVTRMQSGMMAAFKGKSVYFCEPYRPHAWPQRYELLTENDVVGLVAFGSMLAVLTTGEPYIVQGTAPENLIMERIEQNAPCVSADGIVDLGYAAAYPSTDGLITLSQSSGAQNITRGLFERDQWRELKPETFSAGARDGAYVFSFDPGDGGGRQTAMIALNAQQPSYVRTSNGADKLRFDVYTGNLHYIDGSSIIKEFASTQAGYLAVDWQSRQAHLPTLTSFAAILVEGEELADPSGFEATVYRDGVEHTTITTLGEPARLASGLGRRWSVRVKGKVEITRITLAGDMTEIWG
ncbi:DUF4214 domain-containing protein [Roseovarius nitratireducens]|uniref:DUF4214 domain-containing protein n=1 Tax=Roseovarius nitratireducens TaxID=2044597 RepID=UPI000CE1A195|nr:DUF4214 domain-containing protein [Roseovarius nitratireducens]